MDRAIARRDDRRRSLAMTEAIVVLNAGSSSLKFSVFDVEGERLGLVLRGQIEGLGTSPRFKAKDSQGSTIAEASPARQLASFGQPEAFAFLLDWLQQHRGSLKVVGVGHRVVHGGAGLHRPDAD